MKYKIKKKRKSFFLKKFDLILLLKVRKSTEDSWDLGVMSSIKLLSFGLQERPIFAHCVTLCNIQPPAHPHLPTDHVPQCHVHTVLEHLQGWWPHHLPLQPVPLQHCSWRRNCSTTHLNLPWCNFRPLSLTLSWKLIWTLRQPGNHHKVELFF